MTDKPTTDTLPCCECGREFPVAELLPSTSLRLCQPICYVCALARLGKRVEHLTAERDALQAKSLLKVSGLELLPEMEREIENRETAMDDAQGIIDRVLEARNLGGPDYGLVDGVDEMERRYRALQARIDKALAAYEVRIPGQLEPDGETAKNMAIALRGDGGE